MIQVGFKLTKQELYQSLVDISRSRFVTKLLSGFGLVVAGVMLFVATNSLVNGGFVFSFSSAFPLFLGLYLVFLSEITARIQVPNMIKSKNPFTEQIKVKIDKTGFRANGETFKTESAWEQLNAIIETKNFFLFKSTDLIATAVPKRVFSGEELIELKGYLRAVTGPVIKLID